MSKDYDIPVEVREKFCKDMYNSNEDFKNYIDKCAADSYENRTVNELMKFVTIYDVACYYNDVHTGKESVNNPFYIPTEQEDKAC